MKEKIAKLRASASKLATSISNWWENSDGFSWEGFQEWRKKQKGKKMEINGKTIFGGTVGIAAIGTGVVAYFTDPLDIFGQELSFTWLWVWASAAYIGFSFRWKEPIEPNKLAVRTIFGYPTDVLGPGLPFIPLGIFKVQTLKATVNQKEYPAEPQDIWRDEGSPPEGKKPPIRITFRESLKKGEVKKVLGKDEETVADISKVDPTKLPLAKPWREYTDDEFEGLEKISSVPNITFRVGSEENLDGLARRATIEAIIIARWRIDYAIDFIRNIGDEKEVDRQLEDALVAALQKLLPRMSVDQALQNVEWINAHLLMKAIHLTRKWGIRIESAHLKQLQIHKGLNDEISAAAKAPFTARATKQLLVAKGEGAAQAARDLEEQTLIGRAAGQEALADKLGLTGEQVQAAEIARAIADGGNTVIIGGEGFAQLAGLFGAMNKPKPAPKQIEGKKEE
ncbi:MAG: domain / Band 7 family [Candidatus Parcubacteria bacterium]|jgi:regulator of protease activity HflC (stomatin/prohibitin superfamily)